MTMTLKFICTLAAIKIAEWLNNGANSELNNNNVIITSISSGEGEKKLFH